MSIPSSGRLPLDAAISMAITPETTFDLLQDGTGFAMAAALAAAAGFRPETGDFVGNAMLEPMACDSADGAVVLLRLPWRSRAGAQRLGCPVGRVRHGVLDQLADVVIDGAVEDGSAAIEAIPLPSQLIDGADLTQELRPALVQRCVLLVGSVDRSAEPGPLSFVLVPRSAEASGRGG